MDSTSRGREAASMPPLIDFGDDDPFLVQHEQRSATRSHPLTDALSEVGLDKLIQTGTSSMPNFSFESSPPPSALPELVPKIDRFLNFCEPAKAKQEEMFSEFSTFKHQDFPSSRSFHAHDSGAKVELPDLLTGSDSVFFVTPTNSPSPQTAPEIPEIPEWSSFFDSSSTLNPFDNALEPQFFTAESGKSGSSDVFNTSVEVHPSQMKSSAFRAQPELDDDYRVVIGTRNKHIFENEKGNPGDVYLKSPPSYLDTQSEFDFVTSRSDEESLISGNHLTVDKGSAYIHPSPNANESLSNQLPFGGQLLSITDQTKHKGTAKGSSKMSDNRDNLVLRKWNSSPVDSKPEAQANASGNEDLSSSSVNKGKLIGQHSTHGLSLKVEGGASSGEFIGAGGGKGIFKAPFRGAVHPSRPVALELRPHPLGHQRGDGTKVLICSDNAVWSGCDFGLKFWNIDSATDDASEDNGNKPGDQDAAGFVELPVDGMGTECLATDASNKFIWSGHKDGFVRAWHTDLCSRSKDTRGKNSALFAWEAHAGPVLALAVTSYGELWTGSENGALRAWSLDAIVDKYLSFPDCSEYTTIVSPRPIDLKEGIAPEASALMNTDVRFLISEHANGRVWSGGSSLLSLWNARTRDVLKVFGPNAQVFEPNAHVEFLSPDFTSSRDDFWDAEVKLNYARVSKREKNVGGLNFFQRSRNAVMGAADAVRRAAVGVQGGDDSKRLEALAAAVDGTVWGGFANGMLVQWDGQGSYLQHMQIISVAVKCICVVGARIWVGYADGKVQVIAIDSRKLLGGWLAHSSGVIQMARRGNYVFTLARHGGIRGWQVASPSPIDVLLHSELGLRANLYMERQQLSILAATWNVSQEKASEISLHNWLSGAASKASIVFVGLQEMEMGAGAIAVAAAKETVGFGLQEKGTANAHWWLEKIGLIIGEGREFERIASRQLAGIFIGVWVRKNLLPYLGEVDTSAVACGFGRALGNKGAVGIRMKLYRRTFCFVSSHFAAHMDAVVRRNADFEHVYNRMAFGRSIGAVGAAATAVVAGVSTAVQILRGSNVRRTTSGPEVQETHSAKGSPTSWMDSEPTGDNTSPELSEADLLVWVGDLNYRIDEFSYEEAVDLISKGNWEALLARDQLRTEMAAGRVFQGMREGAINFPPTYKFDKGYPYPQAYDSSEKRRVPAWCDRVLFRDSFSEIEAHKESDLSHPVLASVIGYDSCMEAADSDHKPVWCMLNVELAAINEAARRRQLGELMRKNGQVRHWLEQLDYMPEICLNTEDIILENNTNIVLKASDGSQNQLATFFVHCEGNPNLREKSGQILAPGSGFPGWLQVQPAAGIIHPNQSRAISLSKMMENQLDARHEYTWDVEEKDEVTQLVITFRAQFSSLFKRFSLTVYQGQ